MGFLSVASGINLFDSFDNVIIFLETVDFFGKWHFIVHYRYTELRVYFLRKTDLENCKIIGLNAVFERPEFTMSQIAWVFKDYECGLYHSRFIFIKPKE